MVRFVTSADGSSSPDIFSHCKTSPSYPGPTLRLYPMYACNPRVHTHVRAHVTMCIYIFTSRTEMHRSLTHSREIHAQYVCGAYDYCRADAIKTLTRYSTVWKSACAEYCNRMRQRKFALRICVWNLAEDVYESVVDANVRARLCGLALRSVLNANKYGLNNVLLNATIADVQEKRR